jgi:hypothetical protein
LLLSLYQKVSPPVTANTGANLYLNTVRLCWRVLFVALALIAVPFNHAC